MHQYQGTVIAVTHDRYFLDMWRAGFWSWIRDAAYRGREIIRRGLEQKKERLRLEEKSESERQRTLERELEWIRMTPRAKQQKEQGQDQGLRGIAKPRSSAAER